MAEVAEGDVVAGKYRVERILGEGGMGIVVAARHTALDERVALKLMRPGAMEREGGIQRFVREARAVVKLKSEHVARVHDVGTLDDGTPYIVMEHLEGADLAQVLAARGKLPLDEIVDYVLQACDAIAEAHSIGIIHRDLKPGNLFVTSARDGSPLVKVLDFGISKVNVLGDRPESVTNSSVLLGSPAYMSPEQMRSSRDVGPATDIWSIGVILFESLSGRLPFLETTLGGLMAKVLTEPPPLQLIARGLPADFVAVLGRCLAREPAERVSSVAELAALLSPFGLPSSTQRVSRILALGGSIKPPSALAPVSPSPLAATQHPSILGVASTQIEANAASTTIPTGRTGKLLSRSAMALVGLVAVTLALSFVRGTGIGHSTNNAASQDDEAARTARPVAGPGAPAEPASAAPEPASSVPSAPPSASTAPSAAPAASAKAPAGLARQRSGAPSPAVRATVDAGDPFGNQRY